MQHALIVEPCAVSCIKVDLLHLLKSHKINSQINSSNFFVFL